MLNKTFPEICLLLLEKLRKKKNVGLKHFLHSSIQQTNTCSKSTLETLKKVQHMSKVNNKDTKKTSVTSFWCS